MTLPEIRRGFPTYRPASGEESPRVAARTVDSRGLVISYDDVGEGPTIVLISSFSQSGGDWTARALGVEFHELPRLDHRTGLSATDRVMAVVEPFLAAFPAP
jgi:pimeloyl-ACP methyl ester carboxylesterase